MDGHEMLLTSLPEGVLTFKGKYPAEGTSYVHRYKFSFSITHPYYYYIGEFDV